jgi:carboxymethylenebutenolidase
MPDIAIACADGKFSAYVARPRTVPAPGLLVIQEIFGVNQVMRELADGFAAQGYLALCPDLFWRQEPGIQITDKTEAEWQKAFALFKGFNVAKGVNDLVVSLEHLRGLPDCTGAAGSIGYCLGGKLAYLMTTRSSSDCNVGYYGVASMLSARRGVTAAAPAHRREGWLRAAAPAIKTALGATARSLHSYAGVITLARRWRH